MRETITLSTLLSGFILWPATICGLLIPAPAAAAWPPQPHAAVQPVLVTALAFTSLVLFIIYVFTRKQIFPRPFRPKSPGKENSHSKADLALEQLFDRGVFPMAKLSLDGTRVLDATPLLCSALGYSRAGVIEASGRDLGIIREAEMPRLMARGWGEAEASLFNRESGDFRQCRILHIVCRSTTPPCILSIVSGIAETPVSESLPGFISDLLDNRRIIQ